MKDEELRELMVRNDGFGDIRPIQSSYQHQREVSKWRHEFITLLLNSGFFLKN